MRNIKRSFFLVIALVLLVTTCKNPFFPKKDGRNAAEAPVISLEDSKLSDVECIEGEEPELTVSVEGDENDFTFQWYSNTENNNEGGTLIPGATGPNFKPPTDEEGTTWYYVVITNKRNGKTTTSKPVKVTVTVTGDAPADAYTIVIDKTGNVTGDTASASPDSGGEGATITLAYTVADTALHNLLEFGGITSAIASVNSAGYGTRTYTINPADASNGVITIIAVFTHTNLELDPIAFTDTAGHITKTYGDTAFTNAVAAGYSGSGAITYSSSDTSVAVVNGSGLVSILKAGSSIISAEKAADGVYAHAQANYTLTVAPKPVTITGLSAESKVYDGTATATVTGVAVMDGLFEGDELNLVEGTAVFEDANADTGKTVTFSGWSLTGADAGNYILSAQPASVTANITVKSVTITGLSAANKQYDGTTAATVTGTAVISGKISTDTVTVSAGTASFASAAVGNGKTVTFSGYSLTGADAGNYTLSAQPASVTAYIEYVSMVPIPSGTFIMGSPAGEPNRGSNETQHSVTLTKSFYMSKYQVTQAQYQAVMGAGEDRTTTTYGKGNNYPIYYVNWYDAIVFCNKLSVMEGLNPVYSIGGSTDPVVWIANNGGNIPTSNNATWNAAVMDMNKNGYRLPTEAEWEYACRAGTTTAYNTGDTISDNTGWYTANSGSKTHEVGLKPANAWGLYDMHGNVWEWCWDWYGSSYYSSSPASDPLGASSGAYRVGRGGSWSSAESLRSAGRGYYNPYDRYNNLGFRLVRP